MNNQSNYTVMGDDGKEYGPVSADQIRDWIRENRLERKTPVKPEEAKDWIFLEMLPEFKDVLGAAVPVRPGKPASRKWVVFILLILLAAAVFLVFQHLKHS